MAYPKIENKEIESIQNTPFSQKLLDNLDVLDSVLTKEERKIIEMLKIEPLTTKQIRDNYIFELAGYMTIQSPLKSGITKSKREMENERKLEIKSLEKNLKHKGYKIPAFETFDKMLLSLEALSIVARRYDPLKRRKTRDWLWILNPNFLIALKEKKK